MSVSKRVAPRPDESLARSRKWRRWALAASAALALAIIYLVGGRGASVPQESSAAARRLRKTPTHFATLLQPPAATTNALSGTVVSEDGPAIAGARVCATCAACEIISAPIQRCTESDAQGRYALSRLAPTGYLVAAAASGFAAATARQGRPIVVQAGRATEAVEIVLKRTGEEIAGTVVDALGGPIAQASVRVIQTKEPPLVLSVLSDAEGRFSAWVEPGPVTLTGSAQGYAMAKTYRIAPTRDVELVLTPGATVRGRVESVDRGEPIADAEVRALLAGGPPVPNQLTALSREDGSFEINDIEPGRYTFSAVGAHYRGQAETPVAVALGETIEGVVIRVQPAVRVAGRVSVSSTRAPCQRGTVILGPPLSVLGRVGAPAQVAGATASAPISLFASIGADGSVEFAGVVPGTYYANVNCLEHTFRAGPDAITVGQKDILDLAWQVEPGIGLLVRVVDAAARPLPGAAVHLLFPARAPDAPTPVMPLSADREGLLRVPRGLKPGHYTVKSPDQEETAVAFDLSERDTVRELLLRLRGSASLLVKVQSSDGAPIDAVSVQAERAAEPAAEGEPSGAPIKAAALGAGRFRFGALEPGGYRVTVSDGTNPPVHAGAEPSALVTVRADQSAETTLVLARDSAISGHVSAADSSPATDVWVSAVATPSASAGSSPLPRARSMPRRVLTDHQGAFRIDQLVAGVRYTLHAEEPVSGHSAHGEAEGGGVAELRLQAAAPAARAALPMQAQLRFGASQ